MEVEFCVYSQHDGPSIKTQDGSIGFTGHLTGLVLLDFLKIYSNPVFNGNLSNVEPVKFDCFCKMICTF